MTTAELQAPLGDPSSEPTRDMLPHATDQQWAHALSCHAKREAYKAANGRLPRCCELEGVLSPDEFETVRALIRVGDIVVPCNENCRVFGEDIKAAKSVESARRLLAKREAAVESAPTNTEQLDPDSGFLGKLMGLFTTSGRHGKSRLAVFVRERVPEGFWVKDDDLKWLDECDAYLKGDPTNASVTQAVTEAVDHNPLGHIDPFEMLIDSDICDRKCQPLPD